MGREVLPQTLIREIQKHTGVPWWNGAAYVRAAGYHALELEAKFVVDDLADVIEWLREEKQFEKSDRLRTIRGRLESALVRFDSVDKTSPDIFRERIERARS